MASLPSQPSQPSVNLPIVINLEKWPKFNDLHPRTLSGKIGKIVCNVLQGIAMFFYVVANILTLSLFFIIDFALNNKDAVEKQLVEIRCSCKKKLEDYVFLLDIRLEELVKKLNPIKNGEVLKKVNQLMGELVEADVNLTIAKANGSISYVEAIALLFSDAEVSFVSAIDEHDTFEASLKIAMADSDNKSINDYTAKSYEAYRHAYIAGLIYYGIKEFYAKAISVSNNRQLLKNLR